LPSAALPLDLGAGLDGDALLSDPLFASDQGHHNSKALLPASTGEQTGVAPAGNVAAPVVGQASISGSVTPLAARSVTAPLIVPNAPAATLTVNTLADETNAGTDSTLSLREAMELVNGTLALSKLSAGELAQVSGTPGPNSLIQFAAGLTGTLPIAALDLPTLTTQANGLTIQGPGAGVLALDGFDNANAFIVSPTVTATISGLTMNNCFLAASNLGNLTFSKCTFSYGRAAAISDGTGAQLTVQNCVFKDNSAHFPGGAIKGSGDTLTISYSTFTGNRAQLGGAVYDLNGTASITGCTFTGNAAFFERQPSQYTGEGGAICLRGASESATISGGTFASNTADENGAAVYSLSCKSVTVGDALITDNHSANQGAIMDVASAAVNLIDDRITGNVNRSYAVFGAADNMVLFNCSLSGNIAGRGAGLGWNASYYSLTKHKGYALAGSLAVTHSTISGNKASSLAGGVTVKNQNQTVIFANCYIGNNYAASEGGLGVDGGALFSYCRIANNSAPRGRAGGLSLYVYSTASVTLDHCTISGNTATDGGGLYALGKGNLYVFNSTISGNTATTGHGGGVFAKSSGGLVDLFNVTVADNAAAGKGGGLYVSPLGTGIVQVINDTFAFNEAGPLPNPGGGIYGNGNYTRLFDTIVARNSIVSGSTPSDIGGTVFSGGYNNLIGTGGSGTLSAALNLLNVANPLIGTLGNNGGPTQTIMLLPTSPAIDGGSDKIATLNKRITTDERGLPRVSGAHIDIGAVEFQPAGTPTHLVTQVSSPTNAGLATNLGVTVEDDLGDIITGFTGTLAFTSSDPNATLPTPYQFTAADAGRHTFSFTLNTPGAQFVFLNDAADKLSAEVETVTPPPGGAAFLDASNQLFVFQNGTFTNTGAFAKVFSAGIDFSGNAEVWFLDGMNQLWKWDNGVLTNTGGFALHIAAGKGLVAFSDGANQLFTFSAGGGEFKNTGAFASRFTAGFDALGNNQIDFADGTNQLSTFNVRTSTFTNTGAFVNLFVAGQDAVGNNEIWFTDGNNQIWRLDPGQLTQTSGFALTITASAGGTMYFSDGMNQLWQLTDSGVLTNTGGFASHLSGSPGTTALFFSDGMNQLWEFFNGDFIKTGGFAANFAAF
jgi:hypothetical protein